MAEAKDNGDEQAERGGVSIQPAPWTQRVELISGPIGPVLHVMYMTTTTHLHLFGTPEEWERAIENLQRHLVRARQAILLPPGTVLPPPEES